jgi:hypothetical protein
MWSDDIKHKKKEKKRKSIVGPSLSNVDWLCIIEQTRSTWEEEEKQNVKKKKRKKSKKKVWCWQSIWCVYHCRLSMLFDILHAMWCLNCAPGQFTSGMKWTFYSEFRTDSHKLCNGKKITKSTLSLSLVPHHQSTSPYKSITFRLPVPSTLFLVQFHCSFTESIPWLFLFQRAYSLFIVRPKLLVMCSYYRVGCW